MSFWDDLWSSLWGALYSPLGGAVKTEMGWVVGSIDYVPSLDNTAVKSLLEVTYSVFLASLGIIIAAIGLLFILAPVAEKKFQYRHLLTKLVFALVLGSSVMLIGDFCIALSGALAQTILPPGTNIPWSNAITGGTGPLAVFFYFVMMIMLFMLLVEQGVRILMIFFSAVILPWGFLLWSFPKTQSYGKKMIKMFFEWTFLAVFVAIVLELMVLFIQGGGTGNSWLDSFIVIGAIALAIGMPKVMTDTGGAVSGIGASVMGAGAGMGSAETFGGSMGMPGGMPGMGGAGGGGGGGLFSGAGRAIGSAARGLGTMSPIGAAAALGGAVAYVGGKAIGRAIGKRVGGPLKQTWSAHKAAKAGAGAAGIAPPSGGSSGPIHPFFNVGNKESGGGGPRQRAAIDYHSLVSSLRRSGALPTTRSEA